MAFTNDKLVSICDNDYSGQNITENEGNKINTDKNKILSCFVDPDNQNKAKVKYYELDTKFNNSYQDIIKRNKKDLTHFKNTFLFNRFGIGKNIIDSIVELESIDLDLIKLLSGYDTYIETNLQSLPEQLKKKIKKSISLKLASIPIIIGQIKQQSKSEGIQFKNNRWIINEKITDLLKYINNKILPSAKFLIISDSIPRQTTNNKLSKDTYQMGNKHFTFDVESKKNEIIQMFNVELNEKGDFDEFGPDFLTQSNILDLSTVQGEKIAELYGIEQKKDINLLNENDKGIEATFMIKYLAFISTMLIPYVGATTSIPSDIIDTFSSKDGISIIMKESGIILTEEEMSYEVSKNWIDNIFGIIGIVGSAFGAQALSKSAKFHDIFIKFERLGINGSEVIKRLGEYMTSFTNKTKGLGEYAKSINNEIKLSSFLRSSGFNSDEITKYFSKGSFESHYELKKISKLKREQKKEALIKYKEKLNKQIEQISNIPNKVDNYLNNINSNPSLSEIIKHIFKNPEDFSLKQKQDILYRVDKYIKTSGIVSHYINKYKNNAKGLLKLLAPTDKEVGPNKINIDSLKGNITVEKNGAGFTFYFENTNDFFHSLGENINSPRVIQTIGGVKLDFSNIKELEGTITYINGSKDLDVSKSTQLHETRHILNQYLFTDITNTALIGGKDEIIAFMAGKSNISDIINKLTKETGVYNYFSNLKGTDNYNELWINYKSEIIKNIIIALYLNEKGTTNILYKLSMIPIKKWDRLVEKGDQQIIDTIINKINILLNYGIKIEFKNIEEIFNYDLTKIDKIVQSGLLKHIKDNNMSIESNRVNYIVSFDLDKVNDFLNTGIHKKLIKNGFFGNLEFYLKGSTFDINKFNILLDEGITKKLTNIGFNLSEYDLLSLMNLDFNKLNILLDKGIVNILEKKSLDLSVSSLEKIMNI